MGVERPRSAASSSEALPREGALHVWERTEGASTATKCACRVRAIFSYPKSNSNSLYRIVLHLVEGYRKLKRQREETSEPA